MARSSAETENEEVASGLAGQALQEQGELRWPRKALQENLARWPRPYRKEGEVETLQGDRNWRSSGKCRRRLCWKCCLWT